VLTSVFGFSRKPNRKTETEHVGFSFSGNRSFVVCLKTEIFIHRKTEPNCRLKPNAHP
jgi:hypothetical protein